MKGGFKMDKKEICQRLKAVCQGLDNISVIGINNISNIAGSFRILEEIIIALEQPETKKEEETKT